MPKRRTLDQKKKVAQRRKSAVRIEIKPSNHVNTEREVRSAQTDSAIARLLRIELPLVQKDLQRSITTAMILLIALIGIYLFLRYN